jgi:hypothetical protein
VIRLLPLTVYHLQYNTIQYDADNTPQLLLPGMQQAPKKTKKKVVSSFIHSSIHSFIVVHHHHTLSLFLPLSLSLSLTDYTDLCVCMCVMLCYAVYGTPMFSHHITSRGKGGTQSQSQSQSHRIQSLFIFTF